MANSVCALVNYHAINRSTILNQSVRVFPLGYFLTVMGVYWQDVVKKMAMFSRFSEVLRDITKQVDKQLEFQGKLREGH